MEERLERRSSEEIYFISNIEMSDIIIKKVKPILEDELVDWQTIKKGETFETPLADYLLNAYPDRRELVEESEKDSKEKAEKKVSKKK